MAVEFCQCSKNGGSIIGAFLMHHGSLHVLYLPYSPLNRRVSIVVKEKDEDLSASNAAESLSDLSESGEASDRGATEIARGAQSSTVATRTNAHDGD